MRGAGQTPGPVRLKVAYKSPQALIGELTKSVGRGGVRVDSKKALPVGTKFLFELRSVGVKQTVEIGGTVTSVTESAPGKYVLNIRYEAPSDQSGIDAVLALISEFGKLDKKRKHPRIPMAVRAVENRADAGKYRLHDLSLGGAGIDVEGEMPAHVKVGETAVIQMKLTTGNLKLVGEVVWVVKGKKEGMIPRLGVMFGALPADQMNLLASLLSLKVMPAPPWIAKIGFGPDAAKL